METFHRTALVVLAAALWCPPSIARGQTPFDVTSANGQPLGHHMAVLADPTGALEVDEVSGPGASDRFEPATADAPGFGFTQDTYWIRLQVRNPTQRQSPWMLELAYPNIDFVTLYVPGPEGGYEVRQTGDRRPFDSRDVAHRTFLFELNEPAKSQRTYFLRARSNGPLNMPLLAWDEESFRAHQNAEQPLLWMFYGLILVMALYNLFVFASVRQREYFYYCMYVLSFMSFQATINGHLFQYVLPHQPAIANVASPFFLGVTLFWAVRFIVNFLSLKQVLPWAYYAMHWGGHVSLALALYGLFGSYRVSVVAQVLIGIPMNWVMLVATIILVRRRFRPAIFYATAWTVFMVGVLLYYLRAAGILPTNLATEWGAELGAAIEVVLLSLALADRINLMRRDLAKLNDALSQKVEDLGHALRQAEAATRAKGEFLATVSHELRTPLNAIINIPQGLMRYFVDAPTALCSACGSLFRLDAGERVEADTACPSCARVGQLHAQGGCEYVGRPDDLAEHLALIERSGEHLLEVVNGILDFTRLDARRIELRCQTLDAVTFAQDLTGPLRQVGAQRGVALELETSEAELSLRADPLRLRQVLINLIGNAMKFSESGTTVRVKLQRQGDTCLFVVQDQGIGISPADLERIFQQFEQVDQSDTRKYGGTGLGLSIAKSLVEMHDGEIWATSVLGRGSAFHVRLPIAGPSGAARDSSPPAVTPDNQNASDAATSLVS